MEELESVVMSCLRDGANATSRKEIWMQQAFGAVQFYISEHPEEDEEVAAMWSKLKPHFEHGIWGVSFEL